MMKTAAYALSGNRHLHPKLEEHARETFEKKGIDASIGTHSVPVSVCERVIPHGNEPKDPQHNWVKDISHETFKAVNEEGLRTLYATRVEWEVPINFEFDDFKKTIPGWDFILQEKTQTHHQTVGKNVPYSYDPQAGHYRKTTR